MSRTYLWILVLLLAGFSVWMSVRWLDAADNLSECVVHEGFAHHERDFLIKLPELLSSSATRDELIARIQSADPDTLVERVNEDICWGRLLLKVDTHNKLTGIREGCR